MSVVKRRIFLTGLAGAAAAANGRLRMAFLGASHSHARAKIDIARRSDRWDLAGIWEPDPALAERYRAAGVTLLDRDRLLADPSIQVIAVESQVRDHEQHARLALEAGKHVHVEKPPSDTLEGLRRLLDLAARRKRLLQTGYMWRHHPGINAALEAARQGWLGDVFQVRAAIHTSIAPAMRRELALFRGGQMFELGCHVIDPIVRLLGPPDRVTTTLRHHGRFSDTLADNTLAVFEYPRTLALVATASMLPGAGAHRTFEILGTNGTAVVRPIEPPELVLDLAQPAGPYQKGLQKVPLPAYTRYVDEFAALADAISTGRPLAVSAQQELQVQEALLRASEMLT
jgi:predicted dehydrogenase